MSKREQGDMSSSSDTPKLKKSPSGCRGTLATIVSTPGPFTNETGKLPMGEFDASTAPSRLASSRVLVVGAGGLGCEILKDLAMSGVQHIDVIDLDTIDVTNLNRQFLFRMKDVGSSKAVAAAAFIKTRCPGVNITAHHGKIQDKPIEFYQSFDVIISGLDNIDARRWLNALALSLVKLDADGEVDYSAPRAVIPIVDGGTEGFKGQARLIVPRFTACFECTLDSFPPAKTYPMCTIAETPRLPEHCIVYAFTQEWERAWPFGPSVAFDNDDPNHMKWVCDTATARAEKYDIKGVTYSLAMGVSKNIIPAVASTNAVVAAASVNEAIKYLTFASQCVNSYMMYMGGSGMYTPTYEYERKEDCPVCRTKKASVKYSASTTLRELIADLCREPNRLKNPSLGGSRGNLYLPHPKSLEEALRPNLDKALGDLIESGDAVVVTDSSVFPKHLHLELVITLTPPSSGGATTSEADRAGVSALLAQVASSNASLAASATAAAPPSTAAFSLEQPSLPYPYPIRRVSIDPGSHKYVLVTAVAPAPLSTSITFVRSMTNAEYHKDAAEPLCAALMAHQFRDVKVLGGGRITRGVDAGGKATVHIFGYSIGFGKADHTVAKAVVEEFGAEDDLGEGTTITWSDEGY